MSNMQFVIIMILLSFVAMSVYADEGNSLYLQSVKLETQRARNASAIRTNGGSPKAYAASSVSSSMVETPKVMTASWVTVEEPSPKDIRVHDLISIRINEVSSHSSKANTKHERESTIDAKLQDWIRYSNGSVRPDKQPNGDPTVSGSITREFEGKGDAKREDRVSANIMAEVIDVLPNDNLVLEATHTVVTDEETTVITLTGICRSKDVSVSNMVTSSQIAKLTITKNHSGGVYDATKRSVVQKVFDFINPF